MIHLCPQDAGFNMVSDIVADRSLHAVRQRRSLLMARVGGIVEGPRVDVGNGIRLRPCSRLLTLQKMFSALGVLCFVLLQLLQSLENLLPNGVGRGGSTSRGSSVSSAATEPSCRCARRRRR